MIFRLGLVLIATCVGVANADIRTIVRAVETSTAYMRVPTTDNSRLIFKSCDDCALIEARLTPATQYFVRGESVSFADFRREFNSMRRSKEDYALVSIDTETNTITNLRVADRAIESRTDTNQR